MAADEAVRWGLVNKVVPAAELMTAARQLAADVCWAAPLSVTAILDIERRTAQMDPIEAMGVIQELPSYRAAIDSEDAQEGTNSFAEKRPAVWQGR
jgi:crotonobetainyl-CoA hydratase